MNYMNHTTKKHEGGDLVTRLRRWGFIPEQLRTNQVPTNTSIYIHPSLMDDSNWSTPEGEDMINGHSYLYGVETSPKIGLSRRRVGLIESKKNELYSPDYTSRSNRAQPCIDIDSVSDDEMVLDFLRGNSKVDRSPIGYIVTPYTSTIKRLNSLERDFNRVNYSFPKIIMIPKDQLPLLLTKESKRPNFRN